jgi:CheY-like chemotaxis protein
VGSYSLALTNQRTPMEQTTRTILVADDSPAIRQLAISILAGSNFRVIDVENGDAAIQMLGPVRPDVVLADIIMPGKNGYQVCEYIRRHGDLNKTPVILLVGASEAFDQKLAAQVGATANLTKPFNPTDLIELVNKVLAQTEKSPAPNLPIFPLSLPLFEARAQGALHRANAFRLATRMDTLHMEHLIIGLLDEMASSGVQTMYSEIQQTIRLRLENEFARIGVHVPRPEGYPADPSEIPLLSRHVSDAIVEAKRLAEAAGKTMIEFTHLLDGALRVEKCKVIESFLKLAAELQAKPDKPPARIYISYSRRDEAFLHKLHDHLRPLEARKLTHIFYDQLIEAGKPWAAELRAQLANSDVALFLVSPDSIMSEFITEEIGQALALRDSRGLRVIPVLLRPCEWERTPLGHFTALPTNGTPVTSWTDEEVAFSAIAWGIEQVVTSVLTEQPGGPSIALPVGMERLRMAYLAVLEKPELFKYLERFEETELAKLADTFSVSLENLAETLNQRHPDESPPTLWSAWMQTVYPEKLGLKPK